MTAKHNFTVEQLAHFKKYLRVQKQGRFNMFDPRAIAATGLRRAQYTFVMNNYEALSATAK